MKISDEIKVKVEQLAAKFGREMSEVVQEYKELWLHPVVMKQKNREETAYIMLFSQYANELGRPTEAYQFFVLNKGTARTFARKDKSGMTTVLNIAGLCIGPGSEDMKYGLITHYEDTLMNCTNVQNGLWYNVNLVGKHKDNMFKLAGSSNTKYTAMDEQREVDPVTDILSILERTFKRVNIAEMDFNVGNDTKILDAFVASSAVVTTKKETKMGIYNVIDGSIDIETVEKLGGGFSIICDPSLVKWKCRDHLLFVGRINTSEEYGTGMNADIIIPLDIVSELPKDEENFSPESQTSDVDEDTVVIDIDEV